MKAPRTYAFRTGEYLQRYLITDNLYHLSQLAIYRSQLIIPDTCRL